MSIKNSYYINISQQVRNFSSFMDAANEAAISRLYGGIHYRTAIENGQAQGKNVGEFVLQKIHLKTKNN